MLALEKHTNQRNKYSHCPLLFPHFCHTPWKEIMECCTLNSGLLTWNVPLTLLGNQNTNSYSIHSLSSYLQNRTSYSHCSWNDYFILSPSSCNLCSHLPILSGVSYFTCKVIRSTKLPPTFLFTQQSLFRSSDSMSYQFYPKSAFHLCIRAHAPSPTQRQH